MNWNHPILTDSGGFQVFFQMLQALMQDESESSIETITNRLKDIAKKKDNCLMQS